jgi:MFS family permease
VFLLIHGGAVALLAFTKDFPTAMVFAVLWGIGFGGRTPVLHAMRGDYFGRRHYATIMSLSAVPMAAGMTVAPIVAGRVFDVQGTYQWVFAVLAFACVAGAGIVLLASRPVPPAQRGTPTGR